MSELNFELLQQNIRELISNKGITQLQLAEIAGMTQANVSKALNKNEKKQFTLDQMYRIAQHFGVSIDELVGNKAAAESLTSPRNVLSLLTALICEVKMKTTTVSLEEEIYNVYCNNHGYPDCSIDKKTVSYPAFYFPDYHEVWDFTTDEHEAEEIHSEFQSGGNETKFKQLNELLKEFLPVIELYRKKSIPEEAFKMVLKGYLDKLPNR